MQDRRGTRQRWSSSLMFVLAATGSAVGLGNIWKFPYLVGKHGGGTFVLIYLACLLLLCIPIMVAEILIGRHGRRNPPVSVDILARQAGSRLSWRWLGMAGMVAGFLILSYYSVIAGWTLFYIFEMAMGVFGGFDALEVERFFAAFIASPWKQIVWHSLFMTATLVIVARGLQGGLEKAVELLTPALFLILLILIGYVLGTGEFLHGMAFLFTPDTSKFTAETVLAAMGHAFFSLSIAMGVMMVYGAYLPDGVSIVKASLIVAGADTVVAIMAGLVIFPLVFSNHLPLTFGPGLIFKTLPLTFAQMPGGTLFGGLFFVLLTIAALSSSISLIEPTVAWLVEEMGWTRDAACWSSGGICWFLGLGTVFSFNAWRGFTLLDRTFFQWLDFLTSNLLLPLSGFVVAVFMGWVVRPELSRSVLNCGDAVFAAWWISIRFVAPGAVMLIFMQAMGLL